jgi:hypothetical protein
MIKRSMLVGVAATLLASSAIAQGPKDAAAAYDFLIDNGTIYEAVLERGPGGYTATLNGKPVTLPAEAFPASVWHYGIHDHTLLFDLKTFALMRVKITKAPETLKIDKRAIPTERFEFTGDWNATAWFDARKLVQFRYVLDGHEVVVRLDD